MMTEYCMNKFCTTHCMQELKKNRFKINKINYNKLKRKLINENTEPLFAG